MGFKRNITITLACIITECLISLIPMIFMIYLFFMQEKINSIFSTLLIVPYLILIVNVILFIISLTAQIFIKTKYYVNNDCIVVKTETKSKGIEYNEITDIVYDYGNLFKRFNPEPSQLLLFGENYRELLSIKEPSIMMVHMIMKKCKHAKVSYYHNKRFLYFLLIINGIFLLVSILAKLFI